VTDRFHLAATVDRLIYGDEETFRTEDALTVLDAMPKPTWRRFLPDIGFEMKSPGRSSSGAAAGFGNVTVRGEDRHVEFDSRGYIRVGQWKLSRGHRYIDIEQVAADSLDDGRSARINFTIRWNVIDMEIKVASYWPLPGGVGIQIGKFVPWKKPSED